MGLRVKVRSRLRTLKRFRFSAQLDRIVVGHDPQRCHVVSLGAHTGNRGAASRIRAHRYPIPPECERVRTRSTWMARALDTAPCCPRHVRSDSERRGRGS